MSLISLLHDRVARLTKLLSASTAPPEPWQISVWDQGLHKSSNVEAGGVPVTEYVCSPPELAQDMRQYTLKYVGEKQKSPLLFSYATHLNAARGGHKDDDCKSITGIILDCDKGGDPKSFLSTLNKVGIAYTFSYKPATGKFHVIVQIKELLVPPGDRRLYAGYHQSQFLCLIRAFSEIGGVEFDPAMAPILLHIDFPASRKQEQDPLPVIEGHDGKVLDVEKFCQALDWRPPPPPKIFKAQKVEGLSVEDVAADELRTFLSGKAHTFTFRGYTEKRMRHGDRLRRALEGKVAPCAPGELRNQIWYRELAGTAGALAAGRYPNVETEKLAEALTQVFSPALERQHEQDARLGLHLSPADGDALEDMFKRSIRDIRERQARERQAREVAE